jgi:hypothetical protein
VNVWLSLSAERHPRPLAKKRFWEPVVVNVWLSLSAEHHLCPLAAVTANHLRSPMAATQG